MFPANGLQDYWLSKAIQGVVAGVAALRGDADGLAVAEGRAVGEGLALGDAFVVGDAAGEGFAAGASGLAIGTPAEATNCHWPFLRAKVSTKRNWPLTFCVLPSGVLYLPFTTFARRFTTAESLSITLTWSSELSHESAESAPEPMS